MASEIRANKSTNRAGLGTVTYADTGIIVSGIVTCTELSGLTALNISGVGTANTLDINGDIDVDGHTNLDNVSVAGIATFSGILDATNTPASIRVAQDIQHKGDADTKITFPADNTISFDTAGSERLRIKSNGELEISPGGFLTIDTNPATTYGIAEALRIDDGGGFVDRGLQIFEYSHSGARYHRIQFNLNTTTNGSAYTYTQGNYGGSSLIEFHNSGHLLFFTDAQDANGSTSSITPSERLRIDSGGGVQIGTTVATASKLTVYGANDAAAIFQGSSTGTGAANGFLVGNNGGTLGLLWNYENDGIAIATNNVERVRITSGGRVLIGHDTQSSDLHGSQGTTNRSPFFQLHGANNSSAGAALISWHGGGGAYYSPVLYLARSGSATKGTNGIIPSGQTFGSIVFNGDDGTDFVKGAMITAELDGTPGTDDMPGRLEFHTTPDGSQSPVERLRITSGGTVGINDSSPNTYFKLDVNGHTNIVGDIALPTTNRIYFGTSDTAFIKGEHGASAYLAFGANNEQMRLTRTGRLGIGTDAPDAVIHLNANSPAIKFTDSNQAANNKSFHITAAPTQTLRIQALNDAGSGGGNLFDFYRDGTSVNEFRGSNAGNYWFVVDNNNKRVGINTNYSSNALDVWGNLSTKDSTGKSNFYITDHIIKFSQSPSNWSNMNYASNPIFGWDYKNGPGDLMYMASGGNTATADQMALVVSDVHGFKVGRSGYDGTDMDVSSTAEYFRINTGGKVLVNCTSISGGGADPQLGVEAASGSNIGIIQVHAGGGESSGDLSGIAFSHGSDGTLARPKAAIALNAIGSYGRGSLCFYVDGASDNNTVSSGDEKLRITTGGTLEIERGSSTDQAIDIKTTATTGACRIRFMESGSAKGELAYSHNNDQLELVGRSGQKIALFTDGTEKLTISTEGYVTKPNHPGFFAFMGGGNKTTNAGNVIPFDQTHFNNGGHFKTSGTNAYKFVCPVHGIYHFSGAMWMKNQNTGAHARWQIRKNNSIICQAGWHQNANNNDFYDHSAPATVTVECNANDTVYAYADYQIQYWRGGTSHPHSYFSGHLVG